MNAEKPKVTREPQPDLDRSDALTGFFALARRQVSVLSRCLPRVLLGDDEEAIHDLRVATRRLQDVLGVLGLLRDDELPERGRKRLGRVRRALGTWRNLDVVADEVNERRDRTRSTKRRQAWGTVRSELEQMRVEASIHARKRLLRSGLDAFLREAAAWIVGLEASVTAADVRGAVARRLEVSWTAWQESVARARLEKTVESVHAVRIATKRVRYRAELAAEVERETAEPVLAWTRDIQEDLGDWHDEQVLHETLASILGRPGFLLGAPAAGEVVVAELARERTTTSDPTSHVPNERVATAGAAVVGPLLARLSESV